MSFRMFLMYKNMVGGGGGGWGVCLKFLKIKKLDLGVVKSENLKW